MSSIASTYGALLLGALISVMFSGIVLAQCIVYFKMYPFDRTQTQALVVVIGVLDLFHTAFVCASVWSYLISSYGNVDSREVIPWEIPMTILITAMLTFLVQCFFAQRIFKLSKKNWLATGPIVLFATLRLGMATVTTAEMLRLKTYLTYYDNFRWTFTLGLAFSSFVDIWITGCLCVFLRASRTGHMMMDHVLDLLILYAFEVGSLTSLATIVSMICWLSMPHNLIFMGLHFVISKLYSNSLLATLNTRRQLQRERNPSSSSGDRAVPVRFPYLGSRRSELQHNSMGAESRVITTRVEINVEKTVEIEGDGLSGSAYIVK